VLNNVHRKKKIQNYPLKIKRLGRSLAYVVIKIKGKKSQFIIDQEILSANH
jgi:hypothetical protein